MNDRIERKAAWYCNQLSVTIEGDPAMHGLCHCDQCKRLSGGAFTYSGYWPRSAVKEISGKAVRYRKISESGRWLDDLFIEAGRPPPDMRVDLSTWCKPIAGFANRDIALKSGFPNVSSTTVVLFHHRNRDPLVLSPFDIIGWSNDGLLARPVCCTCESTTCAIPGFEPVTFRL